MKRRFQEFLVFIQPWRPFIPITKTEYFLHLLLVIDLGFLLFKNSYDSLLPRFVSLGIVVFDILVATTWGLRFIHRFKSKADKWKYIKHSWYYIPGLLPLPTLRFFLILSTIKLIMITYKFIKRGEKDSDKFKDRELNFTFTELFVDSISDAIFLRSLERVEEVINEMNFTELNTSIMEKHKDEIQSLIQKSIESKPIFKKLNDIPFLQAVTRDLSKEISDTILDTAKNPILGDILKELNRSVIKLMDTKVRKLDLDRITSQVDK